MADFSMGPCPTGAEPQGGVVYVLHAQPEGQDAVLPGTAFMTKRTDTEYAVSFTSDNPQAALVNSTPELTNVGIVLNVASGLFTVNLQNTMLLSGSVDLMTGAVSGAIEGVDPSNGNCISEPVTGQLSASSMLMLSTFSGAEKALLFASLVATGINDAVNGRIDFFDSFFGFLSAPFDVINNGINMLGSITNTSLGVIGGLGSQFLTQGFGFLNNALPFVASAVPQIAQTITCIYSPTSCLGGTYSSSAYGQFMTAAMPGLAQQTQAAPGSTMPVGAVTAPPPPPPGLLSIYRGTLLLCTGATATANLFLPATAAGSVCQYELLLSNLAGSATVTVAAGSWTGLAGTAAPLPQLAFGAGLGNSCGVAAVSPGQVTVPGGTTAGTVITVDATASAAGTAAGDLTLSWTSGSTTGSAAIHVFVTVS